MEQLLVFQILKNRRVVYSDILGYDEVIYDKTGIFPDLADLPGGKNECRRVLLKRSESICRTFQ